MACATTRPAFSFHLSQSQKPRTNLTLTLTLAAHPLPRKTKILKTHFNFKLRSVDVSKEDKPTSESEQTPVSAFPDDEEDVGNAIDKRRLEEKFAVLNTGIYECRSCGHNYDESVGDPSYPIPPGMTFDRLPEDWRCPTCGAAKTFFESKSVEIAGFAQNQQFGLGGNALTSGQKALLIYGSLLLFFALFLSGYFLQ